MTELAPPSTLARAKAKVTKKQARTAEPVSFSDLILAHYLRQIEVFRNRRLDGEWEEPYRRKLRRFVHEHGRIVAAYWCTREPSAVALTHKTFRHRHRFWRKDAVVRLHAETDWITRDVPEIANEIHRCQTLAIRVGEVLRGTSELVAMQWLLAAISRMLGYVDSTEDQRTLDHEQTKRLISQNHEELKEIRRYYDKAGQDQARLVYFQGMMLGGVALALVAGGVTGVLYLFHFSHWHSPVTHNILITLAMGATGAIISVMSRMAGRGAFSVDHEVGRKTVRRLGSFRPFIGATFALALYFGLESDLFQIGTQAKTTFFYAIVSFLAGFSERWAKVLLDSVGEPGGEGAAGKPAATGEGTKS